MHTHAPRCAVSALVAGFLLSIFAPSGAKTAHAQAPVSPARAGSVSVQDLCRIEGQGESVIRGMGLVLGLKGTGDSGADLVVARPLAEIHKNNGNPIPDLKELAKSKSAALVAIEVIVPASGAKADDKLDVFVSVMHSATSLDGGRLQLAALTGPFKGDQTLYAMASGPVEIERTANLTVGRIRGGARMTVDIMPPALTTTFDLVVNPSLRDWTVTNQIADAINALQPDVDLFSDAAQASSQIARALDATTVRVQMPDSERANPSRFVTRVLTADFNPNLLRLPAMVLVNSRTGSIIVTGNVEISAVAIAHKDLVINTTNPPPVPTPQAPLTTTSKSTTVGTTARNSDRARIQDLLGALKAMDVSVDDQIGILMQIHQTGRLHAQLVID